MASSSNSELSLRKTNSSRLDYLYEISVEPKTVNPTSLPLVDPYSAFDKQSFSPFRTIKSLIKFQPKGVREYIQSSRVDQYPILANKKEQFITLYIPSEFPTQ